MTKDTVIGIGLGALVVWLLMRRRGLVGFAAGSGACCGSCAGSHATATPGQCSNLTGTGNYAQGVGPLPIRSF